MSIAWGTVQDALASWVLTGSGLAADRLIWAGQNTQRLTAPFISMRITSVRRLGFDALMAEDNPLTVADKTIASVNPATDEITFATAHSLLTGDGPLRFITSGTWTGMTGVDFWVRKVSDTVIKPAASFPDAMNNVAHDITSSGTGTHTLVDTADTVRQGQEIKLQSRGMREASLTLQCFGGTAHGSGSAVALLNAVVSNANTETRRTAFHAAGIGMGRIDNVRSLDGILGASVFESRSIVEARFFLAEEVSENFTYIDYVEVEDLTRSQTLFVPEDPNP